MLKMKANWEEIQRIDETLTKMPTKEEVAGIRAELFENIQEFSKESARFKKEFKVSVKMIARYDEIMCQKASLQRLFEERQALEDKYDPLIKTIKSIATIHEDELTKLKSEFSIVK